MRLGRKKGTHLVAVAAEQVSLARRRPSCALPPAQVDEELAAREELDVDVALGAEAPMEGREVRGRQPREGRGARPWAVCSLAVDRSGESGLGRRGQAVDRAVDLAGRRRGRAGAGRRASVRRRRLLEGDLVGEACGTRGRFGWRGGEAGLDGGGAASGRRADGPPLQVVERWICLLDGSVLILRRASMAIVRLVLLRRAWMRCRGGGGRRVGLDEVVARLRLDRRGGRR